MCTSSYIQSQIQYDVRVRVLVPPPQGASHPSHASHAFHTVEHGS